MSCIRFLIVTVFFLATLAEAAPSYNKNSSKKKSQITARVYVNGNSSSSKVVRVSHSTASKPSVAKSSAEKFSSKKVVTRSNKKIISSKKRAKLNIASKAKSKSVKHASLKRQNNSKTKIAKNLDSNKPIVNNSRAALGSYVSIKESDLQESIDLEQLSYESSVEGIEGEGINEDFKGGKYAISHVGPFNNTDGNRYYEVLSSGEKVVLTLDARIQQHAEELLSSYNLPYSSLVAIEPDTGRIKAMVGSSNVQMNGQNLVARSSFPAASLFKMITAAAAVETVGIRSGTAINYRGGTYSLGKHNYMPNAKSDRLAMTVGTAMGKSCNPVFARIATNYLSPKILMKYANNFGFGHQLADDFPLRNSTIQLTNDNYNFARTAAGFGSAYISPVHAASIAATIGNEGVMMRPYLVEGVLLSNGKTRLLDNMKALGQSIRPNTAKELVTMMEATVSEGTARKHFRLASPTLRNISVAAKTGTLKGPNPKGTYHWFVAVAPAENPKIAISALVIDNGRARVNGAGLGRRFLEKIFDQRSLIESAEDSTRKIKKPIS